MIIEMSDFNFKQVMFKRPETEETRESGPEVDESQFYRRKMDLDNMVEILLSTKSLQTLPVFIIGSTKEECLVQISKRRNLRGELKNQAYRKC